MFSPLSSFWNEMLSVVASNNLPTFLILVPTVSQLQQALVSIQELLVQQQQKIQELSLELSAAEVSLFKYTKTALRFFLDY